MTLHTMALAADKRQAEIPHRTVSGVQRVLAKVRVALETRRGSWLTDTLFGLPTDVWSERPSTTTTEIEAEVRLLLAAVDGVAQVLLLNVERLPSLSISVRIRIEVDDESAVIDVLAAQESLDDPRLITFASLTASAIPLTGVPDAIG